MTPASQVYLGAIIRTVADDGRNVFFSTYFLEEVERVADDVAMMVSSQVVLNGPLDEVKGNHRRLVLRFESVPPVAPKIPRATAGLFSAQPFTLNAAATGLNRRFY